ncbi:NAD-dependent DNA ligase [Pseudomonas syringae pv. actinidiae]|uniref:NAD-dependent DNA ligase n=1 Tax=Pseudomonas syringae pv. actinidiae TaxID=103796 RepID=A0A2V0QA17_PSESF|nr:NAD-dependent DNA ligase [Pseudomonas syringae pv. actinidiae]
MPVKMWSHDHIFTQHLFRAWAETIRACMALLNQEHQVGNRHQQPPAATISVVQPADTHCNTRDQYGQGVQVGEYAAIAHEPTDKADDYRDQDVEQKEHPIFFSASATGEHRIFLQNFEIPVP